MTPEIMRWVEGLKSTLVGPTLEIGSMDINGAIKPFLPAPYTGIDSRTGRGVDLVLDAHFAEERFGYEVFGTIACCECLEHDSQPLELVRSLRRMLKPKGTLIISTPTFGFPLHRYPRDYYRFGEDAYREVFFVGMEIIDLRHVNNGTIIVCAGRKP